MNFIINMSNNLVGGGLQVALSFLEECKNIQHHVFHVLIGENVAKQVELSNFPANYIFHFIPKIRKWKLHSVLKRFERRIDPSCVFTVFGPSYWKPLSPHLMGFARVLFIYDDYKYFKKLSVFKKIILKLESVVILFLFRREGSILIVETEDAKQRLKRKIKKDKIEVVSNTCGTHFYLNKEFLNKLPDRNHEIRLLTPSIYYPHKNIESIPLVLDVLNKKGIDNIKFVLTLDKKDYNMVIPAKWEKRVYNVGHVPVDECPSLYDECDFLYLPTLLEIFSASYPEAMVMQKPILTSDLSFAHSICGNAALYFDPYSPIDIANKIEKLMGDNELQRKLIENGDIRLKTFGTAKTRAEKYLKMCEELVLGGNNDTVK